MADKFKVSFVICTYNRADYLDDTITSLLSNGLLDSAGELLIIDNNSSDNTFKVVKKHQQDIDDNKVIKYIKEENQGLSYARNRGIKEARTPYIVFLDDDIMATKTLIPAWCSFFSEHPEAIAAGGKNHIKFDDPRPSWMSHFLLPLLAYQDLGNKMKKYPANKYPFGCNMGFKKSAFERYGFFKTDLGRKGKELKASEEKELFKRLKKEGIDIFYLPEAKIFHRVNKQRLTEDYIKRQALGLGQSIALQHKYKSVWGRFKTGLQELIKIIVTLGLFFPYAVALQIPKGIMLIKFRKWILEGYFTQTNVG